MRPEDMVACLLDGWQRSSVAPFVHDDLGTAGINTSVTLSVDR